MFAQKILSDMCIFAHADKFSVSKKSISLPDGANHAGDPGRPPSHRYIKCLLVHKVV